MKIKYGFCFVCLFFALSTHAQRTNGHEKIDTDDTDKIYTVFDEAPKPEYSLGNYLGQNIRYPDSARSNNIEGRVIVKFVVKKNGSISRCTISHSISWDLDAEALRVVCAMPPWKPGKLKGKKVKVWFEQPVMFKLE